jgi:Fe-S cluster assembly iron-binding protein IscA
MILTLTPAARDALRALLAGNPMRPLLRISFVGGCGALGYRLSRASAPMAGDETVDVDGLTVLLDYKSRADLDGALIDVGDEGDEGIVIVHDRAVVGGFC